jgi:CRP-like cAMP-binding protein
MAPKQARGDGSRWRFAVEELRVGEILFFEEAAGEEPPPQVVRRLVDLLARRLVEADGRKLDPERARAYILELTASEFQQLVETFGEALRAAGNPPVGT